MRSIVWVASESVCVCDASTVDEKLTRWISLYIISTNWFSLPLSLSLNPHSLPFPRSLARFLVCWLNSSKCTLFSRSYTTHSQIKANWIQGKTLSLFYCFNIYPLDTFLCCFLWAPKLHDNDSTIINPLPLSISFSPEMGWCGCSCSQ